MSTTTATAPGSTASRANQQSQPPPPLWQRLRELWSDHQGRSGLIGAAIGLLLLMALFRSNLRYLPYVWSTDPNYSHGFLVPLISLYFANLAAGRGPVNYQPAVGWGMVLLVAAVLGRLATILVPVGIVGDLSFLLGLAGLLTLLAGRLASRRYGFALFFLVFMVPLPIHLYTTIASPLQLLVSQIAAKLLNASGLPVLCQGNHLTLPGNVTMFVAEACSGMRQLTGFLALTTAVAYLVPRPLWARVVLIGSAVPVALTANITRVVVTGWIMTYDPSLAQGTFHTVEGLLLMGFGLSLLWVECWFLNLLMEPKGLAGETA